MSETAPDPVLLDRQGAVAVITLNRPEKLNAWTGAMRAEIVDRLHEVNGDSSVSAIVLTGRGRGFCAGQDLAESAEIDDSDASDSWIDGFESLYRAVRGVDKPVIAALNGVAAGSGFQYALLADLRIGHVGVRMGQPEILSGIPSVTGIWAMWSILGRAKTTEFVLTGALVGAEEALRLGLLTEIVDENDVLPRAIDIASRLGALPSVALALTKQRLRELEEVAFSDAFAAAKQIHATAFLSGQPQTEMIRFLGGAAGA